MILDRIQHYLGIVFFTTLVIMQALVFVAVKASNDDTLLQTVFIEPISEIINIDESIYFQAMLSSKDTSEFDFVYFNLKNIETGLDENYQASLENDGTWIAQSAWNTSYGYQPGQYYLSATAYIYEDGVPVNIYSSDYKVINLVGNISIAQQTSGMTVFFSSPVSGIEIDTSLNPSFNISLSIEKSISTNVKGVRFNISSLDGTADNSLPAFQARLDRTEGDYDIWVNEGTIDLSTLTDGNYNIRPEIDTGLVNYNFNVDPVSFNIVSTSSTTGDPIQTETPSVDASSVQILEPLGDITIDQDQLNILVTTDQPTQAGQSVVAEFKHQNLGLVASYNLVPESTNLLSHSTMVDLLDLDGDVFPNGVYTINFKLSDKETSLGQVNITIDRASSVGVTSEIILNSPVAGGVVNGDILLLDFSTNFSAVDFIFTLVKEGNAAVGMNGTIDLIGDGTSWQNSVSAQANSLTNGYYTLLATATSGNGEYVELRSVSFEWIVSGEEATVIPSLFSYQPISSQIGPGDILIASSNILDIKFKLQSLVDSSLDYTLDYIATDCSNSNILNQNIRGIAESLGHTNCFYYILPINTVDRIPNGNYNFFINYIGSDATASSDVVLVSYFDEANQEESTTTENLSQENEQEVTSEEMISNNTPEETTQIEDEEESKSFISKSLAIDFYSTCSEEGINDQERCEWFQATMDSLDKNCIEQGIYNAVACEDYLYRIQIDLDCQENNIIDKEECKNYLLEKYGSHVDCQLGDINLCNNILRNEYLSRLVVGQQLSDNINQAIAPLLGQNISTQDLSNSLEDRGVDSQEILPLSPNQDTKILIVKAQKETILEEEDRLTILNQAVIILDSDEDGLADDLEEYYGTDINNPDTDGDGYLDGEEIKNGYNPAGTGELVKERTDFDRVVLDEGKIIEQPKVKSMKIDKRMEVEKVNTLEDEIKLSGKAEANTWVNIYLYSGLPLVMTTKTDASGNWSYNIKNSLTDGHHRVFVTINDDTGKIVKQSRPISFLIKEARAVTVDDYFDETSSAGAVNNLFIYYILGGAFLVFLALGAIVFLHKGKDQNLEV